MTKLFVIDTGKQFDRPIQKGQWTVADIPEQGKAIVEEWIKERLDNLMGELRYAELTDERGPNKVSPKQLAEDFNVKINVEVTITKKRKKRTAAKKSTGRKAAR